MKKSIYLDYAAATPMDPAVLAAMQPYFSDKFYNPSATYLAAKAVRQDLDTARSNVARILGVRSSEVIFTAGGSEANNLAINGVMRLYPDANMVISAIEHESVLEPARQYMHEEAPVDPMGTIDVEALERQIDDKTVLISAMYANNEIGTIQPLARIASLVKTIRHKRLVDGNSTPLYLHSDACQSANYLSLRSLDVDLLTLNGGKIYGPKQSGALYCRSSLRLESQVLGGGQEQGLRSGTENVPQIIGFAQALELAQSLRLQEVERLRKLRDQGAELLVAKIPSVVINGSAHRQLGPNATPKNIRHAIIAGNRLPNNLHITLPGQDNERIMMQLDEAGIICAVGSACSASNDEPSHVLKAIGLSDKDAQASLRFTLGRQTNQSDIVRMVEVLAKLVA